MQTAAKKRPAKTGAKKAKPATTAATVSKRARREAEPPAVKATGYAVGELVFHPMFGDGTVTAVDADKLTIEFKDGRVKQIVDYYVNRCGQ